MKKKREYKNGRKNEWKKIKKKCNWLTNALNKIDKQKYKNRHRFQVGNSKNGKRKLQNYKDKYEIPLKYVCVNTFQNCNAFTHILSNGN